ncbi:MAG: hypothetical protein V5A72_02950 [Candidatus Nanohaloarchaea archaeon]
MEFSRENVLLLTGGITAALSGILHFYLTALIGLTPLGLSFLVAGLGFFAGIALYYIDYHRKSIILLGLPFVLGQIVMWYWINRIPLSMLLSGRPLLDLVDKVAQIILVITLIYLLKRED